MISLPWSWMRTIWLVVVAGCLAVAPTAASSQSRALTPVKAVSAAELEVWRAALIQVQRDRQSPQSGHASGPRNLVLLSHTIAADGIRENLVSAQLDDALVQRLLKQNPVSVRLPRALRLRPFRVLDLDQYRDHYGRIECDRVEAFTSRERVWSVSASLPAFSDDGMHAIVYTEASAGFGDGHGAGFVFEKVDGQWLLRSRFAGWIS